MANLYEFHPAQQPSEAPVHSAAFRLNRRHRAVILSFCICVLAPVLVASTYLFFIAQDRFVSYSGFFVGTADQGVSIGALDALSSLTGSTNTDSAIVYDYLNSPAFVERVRSRVDFLEMTSPDGLDRFFWPPPDDLTKSTLRWHRLASISHDSRSGVITARISGFLPKDAQQVNQIMLDEAAQMLAGLSQSIRQDSTALARLALDQAESNLIAKRQNLTDFRTKAQIVDPAFDLEGRLGVSASLQAQLAEAKIAFSLLLQTSSNTDARAKAAERKVAVIADLLKEERLAISQDDTGYANVVSQFETYLLEVEYAQERYLAALSALDAATAMAQHKSKYLAVHIPPTLPDSAELPDRWRSLGFLAVFLSLAWIIVTSLVYGGRRHA